MLIHGPLIILACQLPILRTAPCQSPYEYANTVVLVFSIYYIQYILVLMFALFNEIYAALMTISKLLQVLQEFLQKVAVNKPFRLCNLSLVFRGNEAAEAGNMKERRPLN